MKKASGSISKRRSYLEIGSFWDSHDLADYWDETRAVKFDVVLDSEATYYGVDKILSRRLTALAKQRGVSSQTLVNLWIQEKLSEVKAG